MVNCRLVVFGIFILRSGCSVVSTSSGLDCEAVSLNKAPGSNRPNKSISSVAFTNSDSSPFTDFDYEYMKLMANRGQLVLQ